MLLLPSYRLKYLPYYAVVTYNCNGYYLTDSIYKSTFDADKCITQLGIRITKEFYATNFDLL